MEAREQQDTAARELAALRAQLAAVVAALEGEGQACASELAALVREGRDGYAYDWRKGLGHGLAVARAMLLGVSA